MDISKFDTKAQAEKGAFLQFEDVYGTPIEDKEGPCGVVLLGTDSAAYQRVKNRNLNQALKEQRKKQSTIQELEQIQIDNLAAAVVEFRNLKVGKEPVTDAKAFFTDFPLFKEQAQEFLDDRANFLGK